MLKSISSILFFPWNCAGKNYSLLKSENQTLSQRVSRLFLILCEVVLIGPNYVIAGADQLLLKKKKFERLNLPQNRPVKTASENAMAMSLIATAKPIIETPSTKPLQVIPIALVPTPLPIHTAATRHDDRKTKDHKPLIIAALTVGIIGTVIFPLFYPGTKREYIGENTPDEGLSLINRSSLNGIEFTPNHPFLYSKEANASMTQTISPNNIVASYAIAICATSIATLWSAAQLFGCKKKKKGSDLNLSILFSNDPDDKIAVKPSPKNRLKNEPSPDQDKPKSSANVQPVKNHSQLIETLANTKIIAKKLKANTKRLPAPAPLQLKGSEPKIPGSPRPPRPKFQKISVKPFRSLGRPLPLIHEQSTESSDTESKTAQPLKSKDDLYAKAKVLESQEKYSEALTLFQRVAMGGHFDALLYLKQIYMDEKLCKKFDPRILLNRNEHSRIIVDLGLKVQKELVNMGAQEKSHANFPLCQKLKKELRSYLGKVNYFDGLECERDKKFSEALKCFNIAAMNDHIGAKIELVRICSLDNSKLFFTGSGIDYSTRFEMGHKWGKAALKDCKKIVNDPENDSDFKRAILQKAKAIHEFLAAIVKNEKLFAAAPTHTKQTVEKELDLVLAQSKADKFHKNGIKLFNDAIKLKDHKYFPEAIDKLLEAVEQLIKAAKLGKGEDYKIASDIYLLIDALINNGTKISEFTFLSEPPLASAIGYSQLALECFMNELRNTPQNEALRKKLENLLKQKTELEKVHTERASKILKPIATKRPVEQKETKKS